MMFSSSSSDDSMSNDEPVSLSSPSSLMQIIDWPSTAQNDAVNQEDHSLQGIELSPVYPGSDIPAELLSLSDGLEQRENDNGTSGGGSLQSSFSVANNNGNAKPSNPTIAFEPLETFEEKPPLELPTQTRLKVKIKRLKIVGEWRWVDGKDDNCGICRTTFETCCVDCKFPGDDCPLALGACNHAFHMHCIVKWTNAQNGQKPVCPLCRQEWKFAS